MNEDQDQVQDQFPLSTISYDRTSHAPSCPNLQNSQQDQGAISLREQLSQQQHQSNEHLSIGGSSVDQLFFNTERPAVDRTREEQTDARPAVKWMSSKMRLMRKMMGEHRIIVGKQGGQVLQDQAAQLNPDCSSSSSNGNNSPTGIIRVCSNCNTTKTPLWRSGPQGPKSLCNACGIRQMKARRALRAAAAAAAAAVSGGVLVPATAPPPKKAPKEERSEVDRTVPFKKRFKIACTSSSAQKKLGFDDITISLSKKLAFHQTAFPQEEKDAAILLMALSCGRLIHG